MLIFESFTPVPQETWFSYLHRQSVFNERLQYPLYMLLEDYEKCRRENPFDRDFDFDSPFSISAREILGLTFSDCLSLFSPGSGWVMPEHYRRGFCWICLQEQVVSKHYPCYLIPWCLVYETHCAKHGILLHEYQHSDRVSLNLGLAAFVYYCKKRALFESDKLHQLFSAPPLSNYCGRISRHIQAVENNEQELVGFSSTNSWSLLKLLTQIMLTPSYGIVNSILKRKRNKPVTANIWQSLYVAPLCASVVDRALALLLVGIVVGCYSVSETEEIISVLNSASFLDLQFSDAFSLGASCNVFTGNNHEVLTNLVNSVSDSNSMPSLMAFAVGFSGGMIK